MLKVENLAKYFSHIKAVDGIDFQVREGEVFGLLGPNGAGKSTTISLISTLCPPTRGEILYRDKSILKEPGALRQKLGIVPQDIALYPTLTGYQNLSFWGGLYGIRGRDLKQRIEEVAGIIGIHDRLKDKVDQYSGGMKRRLNIGAALLHRPELLIMDEPTVGIDPQSRKHILDTVLELNRQGMTILYTSHYMEEVEYLCSAICIMDQGKIIASGSRDELVDLIKGQSQVALKLEETGPDLVAQLEKMEGIESIKAGEDEIIISGENIEALLAPIVSRINETGHHILAMGLKKPNLEAVFLHLTGKTLRD
ncbi:export ABC transporter ATP-binding protein [Candidatus Formimonas warabiya]|uniref:Export ABC transporter ATP-binding protein n=1 Tax=Formimonas warabiya TaxID=1761012 RepID=A0A3G1L168_FORW1|nr:export ABC transporter ATP-binding protein [Candidatus Formimonas warabiya]